MATVRLIKRPSTVRAGFEQLYILECALRDRQAYLDAYDKCVDEEGVQVKAETQAEIVWLRALITRERARRG